MFRLLAHETEELVRVRRRQSHGIGGCKHDRRLRNSSPSLQINAGLKRGAVGPNWPINRYRIRGGFDDAERRREVGKQFQVVEIGNVPSVSSIGVKNHSKLVV